MTNGIRPARLRTHIRSSSARVSATSRYIATRSSFDRPTDAPSWVTFLSLTAIGWLLPPSSGSEVDRAAVDRHRGLADDLRERRMGVGCAADLPRRRVELERERRLCDEIGRVRPDEMDAERVLCLGVADDLDEPFVFATDDGLGDRLERDLADLVRNPSLLALLLREPDGRDLRPAVRRSRLLDIVDLVDVLLARDRVRGDEPLVGRRVREPQPADHVADGVDVGLPRPHLPVDLDDAAIRLDLGRVEPDLLDVRRAPRGDEQHLRPQLLLLLALGADHQADAVLLDADRCRIEARARDDGDAASGEASFERLADVAVLERDDRRQVLEQRDLDADIVEERGELDTDGAAADDDDVLRQRGHLQHVVARDDPLAVGLESRQRLDARPRREDHVRPLEHAVPAAARRAVVARLADPNLCRPLETAAALDPGDLVLVDEGFEPGPHPLHDLVAPGGDLRVVDPGFAGDVDAVIGGVTDALREPGRFEQRLGRDAAAVEARPADLVLVDERDLQPQLRGAEGRRVAARPGTEHDDVEVVRGSDGHRSGRLRLPRRRSRRVRRAAGGRVGHRGDRTRDLANRAITRPDRSGP